MKLVCMVNEGEATIQAGTASPDEPADALIHRALAALGWENAGVIGTDPRRETVTMTNPAGDSAQVFANGPVEDRQIPIGQQFWIENVIADPDDRLSGPEAIWTRAGEDQWLARSGNEVWRFTEDYDTMFDGVQRFHFLNEEYS